jgi:hypothetical protein
MSVTFEVVEELLRTIAQTAGPFIPPPYNLAVPGALTLFKVMGKLIDTDDLESVDWATVDWSKFKRTMDTVELLQSKGVELTDEEIDIIMG